MTDNYNAIGGKSSFFNTDSQFSIKNGFIFMGNEKILVYYDVGNIKIFKEKESKKWILTDKNTLENLELKDGNYNLTKDGKLYHDNKVIFTFIPKNLTFPIN